MSHFVRLVRWSDGLLFSDCEEAYEHGTRLCGALLACPHDVVDEARALLEVLVNNRLREHRAVIAEARERLAIIRLAAEALKLCDREEFVQIAEALYQEIEATCAWLAEKEASLNRPVGAAPADMTVH